MPARGYAEAPRPCGLCPPGRRRCPGSPPKPATSGPLPSGPTDQARGTTPARRAGPAMLPQGGGDLHGGLAGALGHVTPPVAERHPAARGGGVVAPDIRPAIPLRVRLASIQLDDQGIAVVAEVLILASPTPADLVLPASRRQGVRPLHPGDVPELEQGMGPVPRRA